MLQDPNALTDPPVHTTWRVASELGFPRSQENPMDDVHLTYFQSLLVEFHQLSDVAAGLKAERDALYQANKKARKLLKRVSKC